MEEGIQEIDGNALVSMEIDMFSDLYFSSSFESSGTARDWEEERIEGWMVENCRLGFPGGRRGDGMEWKETTEGCQWRPARWNF